MRQQTSAEKVNVWSLLFVVLLSVKRANFAAILAVASARQKEAPVHKKFVHNVENLFVTPAICAAENVGCVVRTLSFALPYALMTQIFQRKMLLQPRKQRAYPVVPIHAMHLNHVV